MTDSQAIDALVQRQRQAFLEEMPVSVKSREDRLDRAITMIYASRNDYLAAVAEDWPGRSDQMNFISELMLPIQAIKRARKNLVKWMQPEKRSGVFPFNCFGAKAELHFQPLGVVGVMAPWNAPLNLLLIPLAPILAAGNRAVLKPSEALPTVAQVFSDSVKQYFAEEEVAVIQGGAETAAAFCSAPLDHLLFTGGGAVAKKVMSAAAQQLTPVTLELGGKCPVIISESADIADAAKRVAFAKLANGGQACLSPDSVYVNDAVFDEFLEAVQQSLKEFLPGGVADAGLTGIVNQQQYQNTVAVLEDAKTNCEKIIAVAALDKTCDSEQLKILPHLIVGVNDQALAAQRELFSPLMNISRYTQLDSLLGELKTKEKPLGLYVFSKDKAQVDSTLANSFSGGVTVNDVLFHYNVSDLPFGGVGASGMGAYSTGRDGFKQFSHCRAVYRQAGPMSLMRPAMPPYGKLFERLLRAPFERDAKKWLRDHKQ